MEIKQYGKKSLLLKVLNFFKRKSGYKLIGFSYGWKKHLRNFMN